MAPIALPRTGLDFFRERDTMGHDETSPSPPSHSNRRAPAGRAAADGERRPRPDHPSRPTDGQGAVPAGLELAEAVLPLGTFEFKKAGRQTVAVHPHDAETWKPISLANVTLTPAK